MTNFILTFDENYAMKLTESGVKLINHTGNQWTFLNEGKLCFDGEDQGKIIYTNKLTF